MRSKKLTALSVAGVVAALGLSLMGPSVASGIQQADKPVNKGPVNPKTWIYGPRNDDTTNAPIWNPVKKKMLNGDRVVGGTVISTDPQTYCAVARAGYDFTWTEMQHAAQDWADVGAMWRSCPEAAVPGARVAYTDEREIQHALDEGAMVLVVPTVDTVAEAKEVVQWSHFPPMGRRSQGNGQAGELFYKDVPGGYRQTFNKNLVTIVMIETLEGVMNAPKIAKVPGIDAVFAASSDLGNFSGYKQGDPDYEKLVTRIHNAATKAGVRLCGPLAWTDRPDFTCFQGGNNNSLIAKAAQEELAQ